MHHGMLETSMRKALAVLAIVQLAACGRDAMSPGETAREELLAVAANAALQDVTIMNDQGLPSLNVSGFYFPALAPMLGTCGRQGRGFNCGSTTRNGVLATRTVEFFDQLGIVQSAYDAATTEKIHLVISVRSGDGSMEHTRDLTVTGLAGQETRATWNGTGTARMTRVHDATGAQFTVTSALAVENVVVPVPGGPDTYPLSGTITHDWLVIITDDAGQRTEQHLVVVTFNGTADVTITVDGEARTVSLDDRRCNRFGAGPATTSHGPGHIRRWG
jgi:hypothetical protein